MDIDVDGVSDLFIFKLPVEGYEDNYNIYSDGRIFSIKKDDFKSFGLNNSGYHIVWLWKDNQRKSFLVARLVANHFIPNPCGYPQIDHIDPYDKLNNDISNLRWCNSSQNGWNKPIYSNNTSGYKGVFWHSKGKNWQARISVNGQKIHCGTFNELNNAVKAVQEARLKYHGEFARDK